MHTLVDGPTKIKGVAGLPISKESAPTLPLLVMSRFPLSLGTSSTSSPRIRDMAKQIRARMQILWIPARAAELLTIVDSRNRSFGGTHLGELNVSARGGGGFAACTQVGCRTTGRRRICGRTDIYFFVSERHECIELCMVFILIHVPAGFGIIWHGCRNGAFYVELNQSESCALFASAPSQWPQNSRL